MLYQVLPALLFCCILIIKEHRDSHAYIFSNVSQGIWQAGGKMKLFNLLLQYSSTSINRFFCLLLGGYCGYNGVNFQVCGKCTVTQEKYHINI